jgi:hypothetical protein
MKHIIPLVLFTCLIMTGTAFAQETVVPPNQIDALTTAIDNAAEGDVLVLERGGVYPVSAQLIVDTELTLKAGDGDGFKPVVVRLAKEDGTYPNPQFSVSASFSVQNIKFTGAQATAPVSPRLLTATKIPKLHLDGVVVTKYQQVLWPDPDSLIIENCLFTANLNTAGGWGFIVGGQRKTIDYARMQNNTTVNCTFGPWLGMMWGNYLNSEAQIPEVVFDHNTIYNVSGAHGPTSAFSRTEKIQFTNNLYINGTYRPLEFFSDKYLDFPENTLDPDSIDTDGTVSYLGPDGLWVISVEMTDSAGTVMTMENNNISWTSNILDAWAALDLDKPYVISNNGWMAIADKDSSKHWFEEEVTFTNAPDVPMFAVELIAANIDTATAAAIGSTPYKGWNWWDGDHNPVFDHIDSEDLDMSYNIDSKSFIAAADGFPLGDLNWFPEMKAAWERGETVGVENISNAQLATFELSQNHPNPFNLETRINFSLLKAGNVRLTVYNMLGQTVNTLVDDQKTAGVHSVNWDGTNSFGQKLSSGMYFYKLEMGSQELSKKMFLME